jgi:hypothetical protein
MTAAACGLPASQPGTRTIGEAASIYGHMLERTSVGTASKEAPNVIFCNLQNSGSSAIDPILRDLLALKGYFVTPFGPEGTGRLREELAPKGPIGRPFYHWTHDPVESFEGMVGAPDYRFIYLHRDPRDAAVSWAHDFQHNGTCEGMSFRQILQMVVTHNQPPFVRAAARWVRSECLIVTFNQIKEDIDGVLAEILDYIGYFDATAPASDEVQRAIQTYSFESMTARRRGETGAIERTVYMLRKGISGEWKKHFDADLTRQCNGIMGREILSLGYPLGAPSGDPEPGPNLEPEHGAGSLACRRGSSTAPGGVARFQIVSPPFACGVTWLVNALLHLDVKVTNHGLQPGHWLETDGAWRMSERAEGHLKWHLPVLHDRQFFAFQEDKEVVWEHRLDFADLGRFPTVLFVRDPRDAVHSLYRRSYAKNFDFVSYLQRPDEWPDHFPGLFQLPPLETFAYFSWFWLAMGDVMPVKLVRFEDVKQAPNRMLAEILDFIGIERTEAQICAAVESSGFDSARRAMEEMERETGQEFKTVRKALVGEWQAAYSDDARACIGKTTDAILAQLDYAGQGRPVGPEGLFEDYRGVLARILPERVSAAACDFLLRTESGAAPAAAQIAAFVTEANLSGRPLLQFAAVAEAIYYVQRTFSNTSTPQARAALNAFVNLNLSFLDERAVQVAACLGLQRLQQELGVELLSRIASPDAPADQGAPSGIELIEEGIFGFNIVRCSDRYYAIPQGEGEFSADRFAAGRYSRTASGRSVAEVKMRLLRVQAGPEVRGEPACGS